MARVDASIARLETSMARQTRLRERLATELDDILDKVAATRTDADTTRAHVLYGL